MSDTPRTDIAQHNMGSIVEPHYVVDADFSRYLERELDEAKRNYMELIMSVGNKYQNETRHETAKRYIQERENTPIHGPDSTYQTVLAMAAKIRKGEKESSTGAKPVPEFELIEKWEGE